MTDEREPGEAHGEVALSAMRAFTGEVTPDIRGIAVRWTPRTASARVVYDHPPTEDDEEMVSVAEGEVMADLLDHLCDSFDFQATYVPNHIKPTFPAGPGWHWIYRRREGWNYEA